MVSFSNETTLQEALEARAKLEELQHLAALAPELEAQEAKAQSERYLEEVRKAILTENTKLYFDFQQAVKAYYLELDAAINLLRDLARTLRKVLVIKKRLSNNAMNYVNAVYRFNVTHLKQDTLQASFNAENKIDDALPGSLSFEASKPNDPLSGTIVQILSHL